MIQALRKKLTLLFLLLFFAIYFLGGSVALVVFYSGLSRFLDEEISDLYTEILPAVTISNNVPTLQKWADVAKGEHLKIPAGITIFDANKSILETYGLSGNKLVRGELKFYFNGHFRNVRSNFYEIKLDNKLIGYLQIQIQTKARDAAVKHLAESMLIVLPVLTVVVGLTGYFFSVISTRPVERSIQTLKTFVADAGHEFITPVTVVEASLETLEEILKEHSISTEILNIISRASFRMKELASDLIFLVKLDNPETEFHSEILELAEIILPPYEEVQELAKKKEIILECSAIPKIRLIGNLHSLRILVSNLLSNAIKYTSSGGKISILVSQSLAGFVNITVEDNGLGIPSELIEHIFERFYRIEESRSRKEGGSGLGLTIVKAIVERHKGSISVTSELNKGSKFTVKLPIVHQSLASRGLN